VIIDWFAANSGKANLPVANLRVVGAGKSEGGGNFAAVRLERLSIPRAVLENDALAEQVKNAVQVAERTFRKVVRAVEFFVWASQDGANTLIEKLAIPKTFKVDRKRLDAEMNASQVSEVYWSGLDRRFSDFLFALPDDIRSAMREWIDVVLHNARMAFQMVSSISVVEDVRRMRASILGSAYLSGSLKDLRQALQELDEDIGRRKE